MIAAPLRALGAIGAAVLAAAAVAPPAADAAPAAPTGALVALHGHRFCLGAGCAPLHGFGRAVSSIGNTSGSTAPALGFSADGSLIVNGGFRPAVGILRRDRTTDALRQPAGAAGCVGVRRPCARLRLPAAGTEQLSDDERSLYVASDPDGHPNRWVRYARDRRTGALRRAGRVTACQAEVQAPCPALRGIRVVTTAIAAGPTKILLGSGRGDAGALAVLVRGAGGRWVQLPGRAGCVDAGGAGGCAKLACLADGVGLSLGTLSDDKRDLYVTPDDGDPEDTNESYLASLQRTASGGLRVLGCVRTGNSSAAGYAPTWISTLPGSSTVLISQITGNRGTGEGWGQFFASRPGPTGALGKPTPISGRDNLGPFPGAIALAPDGRTAYAIDGDYNLEAWRVTAHSARRLPGRWGTPYRSSDGEAIGAADVVVSPDGRSAYVGTGSLDTSSSTRGATVRAYRIVP